MESFSSLGVESFCPAWSHSRQTGPIPVRRHAGGLSCLSAISRRIGHSPKAQVRKSCPDPRIMLAAIVNPLSRSGRRRAPAAVRSGNFAPRYARHLRERGSVRDGAAAPRPEAPGARPPSRYPCRSRRSPARHRGRRFPPTPRRRSGRRGFVAFPSPERPVLKIEGAFSDSAGIAASGTTIPVCVPPSCHRGFAALSAARESGRGDSTDVSRPGGELPHRGCAFPRPDPSGRELRVSDV